MSRPARRILLAALLTLGLGLGIAARSALQSETWDVVSIATLQTYQDAELLARAWALPVAATYTLQYQDKASTCGPTSIANVWTSLGDDPYATAQSVVEGTGYCWTGQYIPGLTLDELAEIAEYPGHHSPIGGHLEDEDLVFVLDVDAKFGPWLVETERLFAAVDTVDGSSDRERGLLLVE